MAMTSAIHDAGNAAAGAGSIGRPRRNNRARRSAAVAQTRSERTAVIAASGIRMYAANATAPTIKPLSAAINTQDRQVTRCMKTVAIVALLRGLFYRPPRGGGSRIKGTYAFNPIRNPVRSMPGSPVPAP